MAITTIIFLSIFWALQATAQVLFNYGSVMPSRWMAFFVFGNIVGVSSVAFLMKVYDRLNPNMALALGVGGAFLFSQVALSLTFHTKIEVPQIAGIALILIGIGLVAKIYTHS